MPLDCMEKYNTGHQRDPYQGRKKTHSTAAAGSKSNFRDFNRMTLKNCAIMAAKGEKQQSTLPPCNTCPAWNQFSSSKQKRKPVKSLSLKLQGSDFVYELKLCNYLLFWSSQHFHQCCMLKALKHFHKVEKNKKIFHICWIPAVALWPMANSYSLLPPHS